MLPSTANVRIAPDHATGPIVHACIAFDGLDERTAAEKALLAGGAWTRIMRYRDAAGPALELIRNPRIGPIRPARHVIP